MNNIFYHELSIMFKIINYQWTSIVELLLTVAQTGLLFFLTLFLLLLLPYLTSILSCHFALYHTSASASPDIWFFSLPPWLHSFYAWTSLQTLPVSMVPPSVPLTSCFLSLHMKPYPTRFVAKINWPTCILDSPIEVIGLSNLNSPGKTKYNKTSLMYFYL